MNKQLMQFKITLNYVSPKVWRRIQVPETYTFWDLHCAIQDAVGWAGGHLHGFTMSEKKFGAYRPISIQMPDPEWDEGNELDESKELLANWFPKRLKQCTYTYDFGDSWDHTVLFEKSIPAEKKKYPVCLAGENLCPPEDCGGAGGYDHLLKTINNPKAAEYEELVDWMGLEDGEKYDPTAFHLAEIGFANSKSELKVYLKYRE